MDTTPYANKADTLQIHHQHVTPTEELNGLCSRIGVAEARGDEATAAELRAELKARLKTLGPDEAEAQIREAREHHEAIHVATEREIQELREGLDACRMEWEEVVGPKGKAAAANALEFWTGHESVWHRHEPLRTKIMELRNRVRHHGLHLDVPVAVDFMEAMGMPEPYLGALKVPAMLEEKYHGERPAPIVDTTSWPRHATWPEGEKETGLRARLGKVASAALERFSAGG